MECTEIRAERVLRGHKLDEVEKIRKASMLVDFIPEIVEGGSDQWIIEKWEKHFKNKDSPYAVTSSYFGPRRLLRLWVERLGTETEQDGMKAPAEKNRSFRKPYIYTKGIRVRTI